MEPADAILFDRAPVEPGMPLDAIPTRWCVAVLWDAENRPVQAVISKGLRAWLRRRLDEPLEPSRRADVKSIVRSVSWRRVSSAVEADLVFLDAVRACFPDRWQNLVPDRRAWFVLAEPDGPTPRLRRVDRPEGAMVYGPFTEKSAADRWIESATDVFDLCRFNHILEQAPDGVACMYKQLGRCDAPCDGSVSVDHYRERMRRAMLAVESPASHLDSLRAKMTAQASEHRFEEAAQTRQQLERFELLAEAGRIESFGVYLLAPGPRKGQVKLFRIDSGGWCQLLSYTGATREMPETGQHVRTDSEGDPTLMGIVAWHRVRGEPGVVWVETPRLGVAVVNKALRDSVETQPADAEASMEG